MAPRRAGSRESGVGRLGRPADGGGDSVDNGAVAAAPGVGHRTRPDETRPDETRPEETRPEETRPDNSHPGNSRPAPTTVGTRSGSRADLWRSAGSGGEATRGDPPYGGSESSDRGPEPTRLALLGLPLRDSSGPDHRLPQRELSRRNRRLLPDRLPSRPDDTGGRARNAGVGTRTPRPPRTETRTVHTAGSGPLGSRPTPARRVPIPRSGTPTRGGASAEPGHRRPRPPPRGGRLSPRPPGRADLRSGRRREIETVPESPPGLRAELARTPARPGPDVEPHGQGGIPSRESRRGGLPPRTGARLLGRVLGQNRCW